MRLTRRNTRGAAAVETALCMIVFIPVFLYALFLDDLLRHAMDSQETALSTVWDYTVQDYASTPSSGPADEDSPSGNEPFKGFYSAQVYARYMFCDHESGIDSFGPGKGPECQNDESHHAELAAHACWLNPGAKQVYCYLNQADPEGGGGGGQAGAYGVTLHQSYMDRFARGGVIRCSARLGVQNYLLPKTFLQTFSQIELARETQSRGNGIHGNAQGGNVVDDPKGLAGNVYLLPWERLAIVTDTWALTKEATSEPGKANNDSEDLYVRVAQVYKDGGNQGYTQMKSSAEAFVSDATSEVLASGIQLASLPPGDNPAEPSLSIKPFPQSGGPTQQIKQMSGNSSYFNSEWRDWDKDNNKATHEARGKYYLGCKQAEKC
ncbi:hypothetical protein LZ198_37505 [Myxococcus sp. K15C18031901]|uniref:TadE/TadG family type IV pilus assembly protein n=1 Tax=Myxococcus dinghuensis TaxID=2906761 RepID=UPI0020A72D61|nr:hypothetical protein [Myxococcus dinghuensis]MCP3104575.1 hypothetical protein [Myxococcus dinghuensis]